jgi:hypothetical protein
MSRTHDIIDVVIDLMIDDQLFPQMPRMAWQAKLRAALPVVGNIIDEIEHEARADALREVIDDRGANNG